MTSQNKTCQNIAAFTIIFSNGALIGAMVVCWIMQFWPQACVNATKSMAYSTNAALRCWYYNGLLQSFILCNLKFAKISYFLFRYISRLGNIWSTNYMSIPVYRAKIWTLPKKSHALITLSFWIFYHFFLRINYITFVMCKIWQNRISTRYIQ